MSDGQVKGAQKAGRESGIGCGQDWALLPFRREWLRMESDVPLEIAESAIQLRRGLEKQQYGLAPCPPMALLRNVNFELALPMGLAVKGASGLCYLGFTEAQAKVKSELAALLSRIGEIFQQSGAGESDQSSQVAQAIWQVTQQEIRSQYLPPPLLLSGQLESSHVLTRLIFRFLFGEAECRSQEIRSAAGGVDDGIVVLEGNEALLRRQQFAYILDLGELWGQWTQLPLVLQVWQKPHKQLAQPKKLAVAKALEMSEARMKVDPSSYFPDLQPVDGQGAEIDLAKLWRSVNYRFGVQEMRSLMLFLQLGNLLEQHSAESDVVTAKMIRWQERDLPLS